MARQLRPLEGAKPASKNQQLNDSHAEFHGVSRITSQMRWWRTFSVLPPPERLRVAKCRRRIRFNSATV